MAITQADPFTLNTDQTSNGIINSIMNFPPQSVSSEDLMPQATTATGFTPTKAPAVTDFNVSGFNPATGSAAQITGQENVSDALNRVIANDSPFIKAARTSADQQLNSRGLLNSSIAVGAAEDAAVRAALPIAQGDVNTSLQTNLANQNAQNQTTAQNIQSINQARSSLANAQNTASQNVLLQNLRGAQSVDLANIEAKFKTLMQADDSAARFFSQTSDSISRILSEPNIPVDQKQQLVQKQTELLQNGLSIIGNISNLNFGNLLNFSSTIGPASAQAPTPTQEAQQTQQQFVTMPGFTMTAPGLFTPDANDNGG